MREIPRPGVAEPSGAPKVLGKYRCDDRLAGDGWLEVHRGRVQGLAGFDRLFAIVSLAPGALSRRSQAAENLLRAARLSATVQDARLAAITDSGLAPGSAFVVTELVHGVSLRALSSHLHSNVRTAPLPPNLDLILSLIGAEIAGALAAAHDRETPIAHGALAPASVMVTPQGGVKLLNLGLTASVLTPAELAANPARGPFAAPELSRGGSMGPQADMFALGALIAAVATGQRAQGPDRGRALNATMPMLAQLVSALTTAIPAGRLTAAEAEAGFRELGGRSRAVDVRAELGALVRAAFQAAPDAAPLPDPEPMMAESDSSSEMFNDEPTAILNMNDDGKGNPMASLLAQMQGHNEVVEESTAKTRVPLTFRGEPRSAQAHSAPTPHYVAAVATPMSTPHYVAAVATPMSTGFEHESQTVMTSASNLPVPKSRPTGQVLVPAGPLRDTSPVAMPAATGAPTDELKDVTTDEISASLQAPSQPLDGDRARKAPAMTPSGWQPTGDLEGSAEDERPGSLGGIELRPRRRSSTVALAIAAGALCVGAVTGVVVLRNQHAAAPQAAAASVTAPAAAPQAATPAENVAAPSRPVIEPLVKTGEPTVPVPPATEESAAPSARPHAAGRSNPGTSRRAAPARTGTSAATAPTAAPGAEPSATGAPASPPADGVPSAPATTAATRTRTRRARRQRSPGRDRDPHRTARRHRVAGGQGPGHHAGDPGGAARRARAAAGASRLPVEGDPARRQHPAGGGTGAGLVAGALVGRGPAERRVQREGKDAGADRRRGDRSPVPHRIYRTFYGQPRNWCAGPRHWPASRADREPGQGPEAHPNQHQLPLTLSGPIRPPSVV